MSDLVDFLLARIAEDEAEAREAISMRDAIKYHTPPEVPDMYLKAWPDVGVPAVLVGPERILAECEAKRRIVEQCAWQPRTRGNLRTENERVLCILAAVYADHPDYREEWRP